MGGYPHLAHASAYYSYVTGHQGESRILYNAKSTYVTLTKSASVGTIYYTLDEHETDPSKFMTYSSGSSIFISGDQVLSTAVYYNGSFGAVTRQEFFSLPGSGTASNPYQLSTPKQLTALGMFPDAHFILTEDITFTDEDYALTGAVPGQWKPISTFSGTLDGKGHAIYGLKSKLGGLVSSNTGTITSLRMIDHRLHGPGASGAIANWNSGTVTRCYTKSAFTLTSLPSVLDPEIGQEVGGVVGFNNGGTVSYCRNDDIVAVTDTTREAHLWMGGIVGEGKAESCINTGLLVVSNDATINYPYLGGITGGGNVDNCLARGNVYLDIKCNYEVFIAGLSGHHSSGFAHTSIASSYSVTDVSDSHGALRKSPFVGYYQGSASSCYYDGQLQLPEDGPELDFDSKWTVSNEGIVPQGVMDENGHAYRLSTTQIYPTCLANGDQWVVCDICGQTDVITVKAIGHRYTNYTSNSDATCLEDGTETAQCERCDKTDTRTVENSALGHSFGQWYVSEGVERRDCENCGHYETRELPAQKLEAPGLSISANTDTGKPKLSWNLIEGAEKYRIYRSTKKTSGFTYLKSAQTATSYTDTTAEVGVNYYYKIKAYHTDSALNSDWSNTVNRVCDLAKPTVTMSVKTATGQPVVKWETVEGAVKYRVYRSEEKSSGYELVYTAVTARSYTDKTAEPGINYYYKVKAIHEKSSADSAYSAVINRVCDLPKPVVEIKLTSGGDPRLTWEAIEGAIKYRIYRSDAKDGEYELVKTTVTATSFTDKEAASGKTWYYKVRAIHENSSANSAYSAILSIKAE